MTRYRSEYKIIQSLDGNLLRGIILEHADAEIAVDLASLGASELVKF